VGDGEVRVSDVIGGVAVLQLGVSPLAALDPKVLPWFDLGDSGDVWVPPIVAWHRLITHRFALVNAENNLT